MQNPFDQFDAPAPAPQAPGVIMGRPKQPSPIQIEDQQFKREDQSRQNRSEIRQEGDTNFSQTDKLAERYNKLPEVKNYRIAVQQLATALDTTPDPQGDLALTYAFAKAMDPDSVVREAEQGMVSGSQPWFVAAVERAKKEFGMDGVGSYTPETRKAIRAQIINAVEKRVRLYDQNRSYFEKMARNNNFDPYTVIGEHDGKPFLEQLRAYDAKVGTKRPQMAGDVPVGTDVTMGGGADDAPFDRNAYLSTRGLDPNKEATIVGFWNSNRGNSGLTEAGALRFYAEQGVPPPSAADLQRMIEQAQAGFQFGPVDTSQEEAAYRAELEKASQAQGGTGYTERADQGITLGLSDEAAGVGGAIGSLLRGENPATGYQFSRDVQRFRNEQADQNTGLLGDAVEIGSSLFVPLGGAITSPARAARIGATAGAVGGFGYGEGAQNSTVNALIGAGGGAVLGAAGTYGGNALMNRATQRSTASNEMVALDQAANELGMAPLPRIISNPAVERRGRAVAGTIAGGQRIREGVRAFGDDIEGAVNSLSTGTAIRDNEVAGGIVREAAQRQIKQTGESARRSYDRAEKLAGNARVTPLQSVQLLDQEIASLSETAGLNSAEISFLQTLKDDFSKDLSVGALRRARTTLRKKISKGDLVFGENEARVLSVMDAAAADIEAGLRSQGKGAAAQAFRAADTKYRARMDYINNTLQKVIGKRDSNLSNEAVLRKFRGLATPGGDSEGLKKFYASLTPDEAADVSATFAEMLGRGGKDGTKDFSTAVLVDNIEQLKKSGATMTTLFGRDGAKALDNILLLAREHKRVTGAISGQGSAQGNDWRWMLASMFLPGAGTAVAGGDAALAAGMGVAGFAIKAGRDALSAKLLMSPRFTNWMRTAPRTSNPAAINAHFAKLGAIGKAEPAIASEVGLFREALLQAANDNANKAVAEDGQQ